MDAGENVRLDGSRSGIDRMRTYKHNLSVTHSFYFVDVQNQASEHEADRACDKHERNDSKIDLHPLARLPSLSCVAYFIIPLEGRKERALS